MDTIGIQLYTLRDLLAEDFAGTLGKLSDIGYREVEFAGYFQHSPAQVAGLLRDNGLQAPAGHVSLPVLKNQLQETVAAAQRVGHRYLVLPWVPPGQFTTLQSWEALARDCNTIGAACRESGLVFAYHNHDFEFQAIDGKLPYDVLVEQTDPALVQLELDLFWAVKAGVDPLRYLRAQPGRFPLVHVKDMSAAGKMVDVGAGTIDFSLLLSEAKALGTRHFFVEHDQPADALATARNSFEALAAL